MGTQQSGVLNLKIADVVKDGQILKLARETAKYILENDPNLEIIQNKNINSAYRRIAKNQSLWMNIS